jgi:urocanate hydratase
MSIDENEIIEGVVQQIMDLFDDLADDDGIMAAHLVMAAQAVAVRVCWAAAKDRSKVREMLAIMIDDFVTQTESGAPMVTQ